MEGTMDTLRGFQIGPKKKVGVFLICTGSEPDEMKRHVSNILMLPSVNWAITEFRTEVFTDYGKCRKIRTHKSTLQSHSGKAMCFYLLWSLIIVGCPD